MAALFLVNGAAGGSWFARIPAVQAQLELTPGMLGLALLAAPVGAVVTMPAAGGLAARYGSRRVVTAATLATCVVLPLLALAPSLLALVLVLLASGVANGAMDVAMNAEGVAVERLYRRPIMSSLHAAFSVGGMLGAATGGLAAGLAVPPAVHLLAAGVALAILGLVASGSLLPTHVNLTATGPAFARPTSALLGLGAIAFCVMLAEGAMADWSAVYMHRVLETTEGLAALGYASFALTMAVGRVAGDALTHRLGPVTLARIAGSVATLGLGLVVGAQTAALAIPGFALVGAGLSVVAPMAYSAAGRSREMPAGPAIAIVTTLGYLGFLAGPPVIGLVAEILTLRGGLALVAVLSLAIVGLAGTTRAAAWGGPDAA